MINGPCGQPLRCALCVYWDKVDTECDEGHLKKPQTNAKDKKLCAFAKRCVAFNKDRPRNNKGYCIGWPTKTSGENGCSNATTSTTATTTTPASIAIKCPAARPWCKKEDWIKTPRTEDPKTDSNRQICYDYKCPEKKNTTATSTTTSTTTCPGCGSTTTTTTTTTTARPVTTTTTKPGCPPPPCCMTCDVGVPCGNSCIAKGKTCTKAERGCACTVTEAAARGTTIPKPTAACPKFCCKTCDVGVPCGNSCIAKGKTCSKPEGCACPGQKKVNLGGYACGKNKVFTIWHPKPCRSRLKTPYFVATDRFRGRGRKTAEEWDKLPAFETRGVCTGESLYRVPG